MPGWTVTASEAHPRTAVLRARAQRLGLAPAPTRRRHETNVVQAPDNSRIYGIILSARMRPKMRWGVASYRDAIKLLLTWFKDTEWIPPEKLRLIDIDRPRVLRFLDWLEAERGCSTATRNQRLAVIIRGALLPALPHDPAPRAPEGPQCAGVVVPAGESCGVDVLGPGVPVAGAVGQGGERGP